MMLRPLIYSSFVLMLVFLIVNCRSPNEIFQYEIKETKSDFYLSKNETDSPSNNRNLHVNHYPASNERRIDLFHDYVQNKRGIYIGVGTDQNLTFIAWAKSEIAYLIDFDIVAVYVNKIHLFFITQSPSVVEFSSRWNRKNKNSSFALLKKNFSKNKDWRLYQKAWKVATRGVSDVPERFRELKLMEKKFKLSTFTNNPKDYAYIRKLAIEQKIIPVSGDLKGEKTLKNIAKRARIMQIPVRVLYLSNAEDYFLYPQNMRKNFLSLPVDKNSVVIRTISVGAKYLGFPVGEKFPDTGALHYNVQSIETLQSWMRYSPKRPLRTMHMLLGKGKKEISHGFSLQVKTPYQLGLTKNNN